jgi:hypothetical protein
MAGSGGKPTGSFRPLSEKPVTECARQKHQIFASTGTQLFLPFSGRYKIREF